MISFKGFISEMSGFTAQRPKAIWTKKRAYPHLSKRPPFPRYEDHYKDSLEDIAKLANQYKEQDKEDSSFDYKPYIEALREIYRLRREDLKHEKRSGLDGLERHKIRMERDKPHQGAPSYRLKDFLEGYKKTYQEVKSKNPSDPILQDLRTLMGNIVKKFKR